MFRKLPPPTLGLTLLWIWLGILLALAVGYGLLRWWQKGHPSKLPHPDRPYALQLRQRLSARRAGTDASKRVGATPPKGD